MDGSEWNDTTELVRMKDGFRAFGSETVVIRVTCAIIIIIPGLLPVTHSLAIISKLHIQPGVCRLLYITSHTNNIR
jgi:hypothetical protein